MKKTEAIEFLNKLNDGDEIIVRTATDEAIYLDNYRKAEVDKEIKSKTEQIYTGLDNDIFEVTGLRKPADKKTYHFVKELVTDMKSKADKLSTLESKLADYERQIQEGTLDKAAKKRVEELTAEIEGVKSTWKKEKKTYEDQIAQLQTAHRTEQVRGKLESAMIGLQFKPYEVVPEVAQKALINQVIGELSTMADFVDGKLVFKNDKGEIIPNPTTMNPKTAQEMISELLSPIIDGGHKIEGTGSQTKVNGKPSIPATIKDLTTLAKWMSEQGIARGTDRYNEIQQAYKDLPLLVK